MKKRKQLWMITVGVAIVFVVGVWKLHADSKFEYARRVAWRDKALSFKVPVYPERSQRVGILGVFPFIRAMLPPRRETIVQALSDEEAENLMHLELTEYPPGLVIMVAGMSAERRERLAERYPTALIVDYPNMPE